MKIKLLILISLFVTGFLTGCVGHFAHFLH